MTTRYLLLEERSTTLSIMTRQNSIPPAHIVFTAVVLLLPSVTNGDICRRQPIRIVLQRDGCQPRALIAFGCGGACTSYSSPSSTLPTELEQFCQCCDAIDYANRLVSIQCWDASYSYPREIHVNMNLPSSCRCRPCNDTPEYFVPADDFWNRHKRVSPAMGENSTINATSRDRLLQTNRPYIHIEDPDLKFTVEPLAF